MSRGLDIPPPVLEEQEEEYLDELSQIKEAEDWIEKHSVIIQSSEKVEQNLKSRAQALAVNDKNSIPNKGVSLIFGFMSILVFYIFFIPGESSEEFCFVILFLFIMFIPFRKVYTIAHKQVEKDKTIVVQEDDYAPSKSFSSFIFGFSIPFSIWILLFATLGQPCSVFCSGKESWSIFEIFFANIGFGIMILIFAIGDAMVNKKLSSILFFLGFCSGSFIGLMVGELFA